MALKAEARDLLLQTKASGGGKERFPGLYKFHYLEEEWHCLITGVGMDRSRSTLRKYFEIFKPDQVINLGLAGTVSDSKTINSTHELSRIYHAESGLYFDSVLVAGSEKVELVSCEKPVMLQNKRKKIRDSYGDVLVDMEAFVICEQSYYHKIPFRIIKLVSDFADEQTMKMVKENIFQASSKLTEIFFNLNDS